MNILFMAQLLISAVLGIMASLLYPGFSTGQYSSIFLTIVFITIFLIGKGFGEICTTIKNRDFSTDKKNGVKIK